MTFLFAQRPFCRWEKPDYTGLDVIIVRGDEIAALYVFPRFNAIMPMETLSHLLSLRDPVAQTFHTFCLGAVVAAVECAVLLQSVAHDLDAAMGT
jgi:hypothetical protein